MDRREYELSEHDLLELKEAGRPVMYIIACGVGPMSPQESANRVWEQIGRTMGFQYMTVRPIPGKPERFFSAVPL